MIIIIIVKFNCRVFSREGRRNQPHFRDIPNRKVSGLENILLARTAHF